MNIVHFVKYLRKRLLTKTRTRARRRPDAPPKVEEQSPFPALRETEPIPEISVSEASFLIGPLYGLPPPALESSTLNEAFSDWDSFRWARIAGALIDRPAFSALWNARLPVNQLPVEILVAIFQLVPDPPFFRSDRVNGPEWVLLGRVCRHWRAVLLEHACFWRTIFVRKHPHWFQLAVTRSQQALLELEVHDVSVVASVDVSIYRDRMRSLEVGFRPRWERDVLALSSIISGPLPSLRRLKISTLWAPLPQAAGTPDAFILDIDNYPRLAHLTLSDVAVPWSTQFVSQLTTLEMSRCSVYPSRVSFDVFLDVLEHGQQLEHLTLDRFLPAACYTASPHPRPRNQIVALPRLRSLTVNDEAQWIRWLTASIQLPNDTTLKGFLTDTELQDSTRNVVDHAALLNQANDRKSFFRQSHEVVIYVFSASYTLKFCCGPAQQALTVIPILRFHYVNAVLDQLVDLFDPGNLTSLSLLVPTTQLAQETDSLLRLLNAFYNLTRLSLSYGKDDSDAISGPIPGNFLHLLCSPADTASNPTLSDLMDLVLPETAPPVPRPCVCCPKLEQLTLNGFDWEDGALMEAVLSCLRTRASHGAPPLKSLSVTTVRQSSSGDWRAMDERYANAANDVMDGSESAWYSFNVQEVVISALGFRLLR